MVHGRMTARCEKSALRRMGLVLLQGAPHPNDGLARADVFTSVDQARVAHGGVHPGLGAVGQAQQRQAHLF